MYQRLPWVAFAAVAAATLPLPCQRGGGPSEAIASRSGSYFVDVRLPPPAEEGADIDLASCALVEAAAKAGQLALLYVFDPAQSPAKHEQFEQTIFGHGEISTSLVAFRCGRVDLSEHPGARDQLERRTPLFVAFDAAGKAVGEVSFHDYRARATPLVKLLDRAAARHGDLPLADFVTRYRRFLNDYQVYEGRVKTLQQRRQREQDKGKPATAKLAELDAEMTALERSKDELLETEKQLLAAIGAPPRDPAAKRLGDRRRR